MTTISPQEVKERLDKGEKLNLVDVGNRKKPRNTILAVLRCPLAIYKICKQTLLMI